MSEERIPYLLALYMNNSCSPKEKEEFLHWVGLSTNNEYILDLLEKAWHSYIAEVPVNEEVSERHFNNIISRVKPPGSRYFIMSSWVKYAAVLLIMAGTAGLIYIINHNPKQQYTHVADKKQSPVKIHDVSAPKLVHAFITTASGNQIILDNTKNGTSIDNFQKVSDGSITYSPVNAANVEYHTLSVPRGSKIVTVTLSDTSKVWLNDGSSLTYPTVFTGNQRKVTIKGEAYFEISHNAEIPFIVEKDDAVIQVLGTHFNVNAYEDEADMKVTLIQGSVKVSRGGQATTLSKGQQAELASNGKIRLNKTVNLDEVLAWKMGRFVFNDTDIKVIMRQIMKWYNVEVLYEGKMQERFFTGDLSRDTDLSELLKVLELNNINFHLQGNKLIVKL